MTKIAGSGSASGSISQIHGSADSDPDPDPHQNVMDQQNWMDAWQFLFAIMLNSTGINNKHYGIC
jgi:hypothetical protein